MISNKAAQLWPIIKAFGEGKTVQFRSSYSGVWVDAISCSFDCTNYEYRIKPEPRFRAWKPEEVPVGALLKYAGWKAGSVILESNEFQETICYSARGVINQKSLTSLAADPEWQYSTDHGKTWLPCGVMEEVQ